MIPYYLQENPFQKGKEKYIGKAVLMEKLDAKEIISLCAARGNKIPEYMVESVLKRFEEVIEDALKKGIAINTPIINIAPTLTGTFNGQHDQFDKNRHQLHFRVSEGTFLKRLAEESELFKVDPPNSFVQIHSVKSLSSPTEEYQFEAGSILELKGKSLKYDKQDQQQGIFLINEESQKEYRMQLSIKSTKSYQMFQIPLDIEKGSYLLEIRCLPPRYTSIRHGRFYKAIIII
ncbi:DNA-binding domain-containing protein [Marinifilum flexuosum]|uniref:DNA-binding domain-containing protein n=1 Tax=Marinifilum flexuosum TaxID=1117708 RepID=UPI002490782B|nr:DNA-binding domain-containing protein [Marinifilum flexuosum]